MSGIIRIKIKSDWHNWRTQLASAHEEIANSIYRSIFPLAEGCENVEVTKSDAMARYDWKEGIGAV